MSSIDLAGPTPGPLEGPARDAAEPFDRIARLARRLLGVDGATVSVLDTKRQTFKGQDGLPAQLAREGGLPTRDSLCRLVVASGDRLALEDARTSPLARESATVTEHDVVSYAGTPLELPTGEIVGTLCVLQSSARHWEDDELAMLDELAALALTEIQFRLRLDEIEGIDHLARRLPEPVERLGDAVRSTASLAADPQDPRLPRMADLARGRLKLVEAVVDDLQRAVGQHQENRPPVVEVVDLRTRVERTVRMIESSVRPGDLQVELPGQAALVQCRVRALDRALSLLLMNALHHMVGGEVRVEVGLGEGSRVTLTVTSPGGRMPVNDLFRVVDAFAVEGEDDPTEVSSRRGRTRVRNHRAHATTDDSGTTVTVTLPSPGVDGFVGQRQARD